MRKVVLKSDVSPNVIGVCTNTSRFGLIAMDTSTNGISRNSTSQESTQDSQKKPTRKRQRINLQFKQPNDYKNLKSEVKAQLDHMNPGTRPSSPSFTTPKLANDLIGAATSLLGEFWTGGGSGTLYGKKK